MLQGDNFDNSMGETGREPVCPNINSLDPERVLTTTYGERPDLEKDFNEWVDQEFDPIPIKFELTPIVNLITEDNLDDRHNISSSKILKWFLPLYLKYCKVFDFDCSPETGCGFNDYCKFDENCIRDRSAKNGYRCQGEKTNQNFSEETNKNTFWIAKHAGGKKRDLFFNHLKQDKQETSKPAIFCRKYEKQ